MNAPISVSQTSIIYNDCSNNGRLKQHIVNLLFGTILYERETIKKNTKYSKVCLKQRNRI